jgi:hypothetical protein
MKNMSDNPGLTSDLIVFIPSFDRPMQLDATLKSFYKHCNNPYQYEIQVIYRVSDYRYKQAYESLKTDYENVIFSKEYVFKQQLIQSIANKKYILFVVDDCIFVNNFNLEIAKDLIKYNPEAIGFSLRLGKNTKICYPNNALNELPKELNFNVIQENKIDIVDWTKVNNGDFGYPLEVSSSLYEICVIENLINNYNYKNPNDLEWVFACCAQNKKELTDLFFYETSVAFCNPVNKVQKVNQNRSGSFLRYSTEELLHRFEQGERIDIDVFDGFVSNGCHQEVDLIMRKEDE